MLTEPRWWIWLQIHYGQQRREGLWPKLIDWSLEFSLSLLIFRDSQCVFINIILQGNLLSLFKYNYNKGTNLCWVPVSVLWKFVWALTLDPKGILLINNRIVRWDTSTVLSLHPPFLLTSLLNLSNAWFTSLCMCTKLSAESGHHCMCYIL